MTQPALTLVDANGEVHDRCPGCADLEDQLAGAEKEIRGWRTRYANLARDREATAREHELYPEGQRWHDVWRERCRHPRSEYGPEEFWLILPFLRHKTMSQFIDRAIAGAAFDPYAYRRKNGTVKRCDEFGRIFKDKRHFKDFVAKAPKEAV